jgi:hypothetical protein
MPIHLSPRPIRTALRRAAGSPRLHRAALIVSTTVVLLAAVHALVVLRQLAPISGADIS